MSLHKNVQKSIFSRFRQKQFSISVKTIKSMLLATVVFVFNRAVLNHRLDINSLSFVKMSYQLKVRLV